MSRRPPRSCPTCDRIGSCADCCCASPDHTRGWPQQPFACSLCGHPTTNLTPEAFATQSATNKMLRNLSRIHPD